MTETGILPKIKAHGVKSYLKKKKKLAATRIENKRELVRGFLIFASSSPPFYENCIQTATSFLILLKFSLTLRWTSLTKKLKTVKMKKIVQS